ncbi:MAG: branched-chain amino acid transport system II carrier protein [Ruminococcaceae bacterium]|jgi:LIVCS family branched-chain amino acid:cation transporter|nr:branched-chain amino acid transport system II carrier protein [Oscillospiraceae bacterium]
MKDGSRKTMSDMIVVGFTMFAIFFGAGNLIFPPYLGMLSGSKWFLGFLCFIIADAGLAMTTVVLMTRGDGSVYSIFGRLGKSRADLVAAVGMIVVGPIICIPRTAATTYEMAAVPIVPQLPAFAFSLIFFAIVYLLTVRPSKVVDYIGKFLTPMLLLTLAVLFVKGIVTPIGAIRSSAIVDNVMKEGFMAGYQTMDVLGAMAITIILTSDTAKRGYDTVGKRMRIMIGASVVATVGLFLVYCGLAYLGATTSLMELGDINQTGLVVLVTELLLKRFGVVLLALIVFFACMTTAVGLVSASAEYFTTLLRGRLSYRTLVLIMCLFGLVISNAGITTIINLAAPMLDIIYPVMLTQIFLTLFNGVIKNDNVFKGAAVAALIVCTLSVAADLGLPVSFIRALPLSAVGFGWVLPSAAGGLIGAFIPDKKNA